MLVVMQMSQQLGQAQQQAQASLEALQEQIRNELDRKYPLVLMVLCSLSERSGITRLLMQWNAKLTVMEPSSITVSSLLQIHWAVIDILVSTASSACVWRVTCGADQTYCLHMARMW